jgi:hypothetical protein
MKPSAVVAALVFGLLPWQRDPEFLDFKVLSEWEYTDGMKLPDSVTKLDRKKFTLSGFMRREDSGFGEVEFFLLVYENCGCTGTPKINELVYCAMPEGVTTPVHPGPVKVSGTLYVAEQKDDGVVYGIYAMDVDKVTP